MEEGCTAPAGKYVCFQAGRGRYGIPIDQVMRIIRQEEIIEVPRAPSYVRGVINLRGEVIPIINIRDRFGLPRDESARRTRVIIVQNQGRPYGLQVDEVRDIVEVREAVIDREIVSDSGLNTEMITGIARIGEGLVLLLDIARVIASAEAIAVRA